MKIYNLLDKKEFLKEVAILEYEEWANDKEYNKESRLTNKIKRIQENLYKADFCKLILEEKGQLIGFISIFKNDCDECMELSPWYATMYVKEKYRGKGYSKILNDAILKEARKRNYERIYLKTTLNDYYEKFGAKFIKQLDCDEKIYVFEL